MLEAALRAGHAQLQSERATGRDAVVAAIRVFEDSPLFNAGKGAAFTGEGRNELDAAIMDGRTRRAGAVAGVTTVKNPIVAARLVMEKSPHVLLCGQGADAFARRFGAEIVDPAYFYTDLRWKMLEDELRRQKAPLPPKPTPHRPANPRAGLSADRRFGTVGCDRPVAVPAVAAPQLAGNRARTAAQPLSNLRPHLSGPVQVGYDPMLLQGKMTCHRGDSVRMGLS